MCVSIVAISTTTNSITLHLAGCLWSKLRLFYFNVNNHHHVPEGLGVFPVPWSSRWIWSLHLFLTHLMFLRPLGLYYSACFGSLFVSILCSHFFLYCFISFTMFCFPVFCPIHWFFSLSSFVIPSKCLKNVICAASKRCSSLFFSTQASLPNFNATLAVMLWNLNFVSLSISFPKCLRMAPFILLYVCNLSSKSLLYSDVRYPKCLKSVTCSIILPMLIIFQIKVCGHNKQHKS